MDRQTILERLRAGIEDIRGRFAVKTLLIFGSLARDQATDDSDIDVLVTFERKPNFDIFMDLKFYLEELLGTSVDLVTDKALRPQVRKAIEQEAIHVA